MKTDSMQLLMSQIERASNTQARAQLNTDAIAEYRRLLDEGKIESVPFLDVFFDGATYHIGDGWHRFEAFTEAGLETIPCRIHKGSERDARMFACAANQKHGVRRTQADRRRAVELMLEDSEWSEKSSRAISDYVGVSHTTVDKIRAEFAESTGQSGQLEAPRAGTDGKVRRQPSRRTGPSASKSESNGTATAVMDKPKSGDEKITPAARKQAKAAFGVVVRFVDQCEEQAVSEALAEIAEAMQEHWG